jgi:hypothetical protein
MVASLGVSQLLTSRVTLQADSLLRVQEVGSGGWRQFENPDGGEHPLLGDVTKQRNEDPD